MSARLAARPLLLSSTRRPLLQHVTRRAASVRPVAAQNKGKEGMPNPPGRPLSVPNPLAVAAALGGLSWVTLLGFNSPLLPGPLRDLGLSVVTEATAKTIATWAWAAHAAEAVIAVVACLSAGADAGATAWWAFWAFFSGGDASTSTPSPSSHARYAVIGGGFAGVAAAWHLVAAHTHAAATTTPSLPPPHLTLFDPRGLCGGASAAAGGLLHPFTPSGGLLWEGEAAFADAAALVAVAEAFCEANGGGGGGGGGPVATRGVTFLRPAEDAAQAADWVRKRAAGGGGGDRRAAADLLTAAEAGAALPGVALPSVAGGGAEVAPPPAAWATTAGLVVHPARYLECLWGATAAAAAAAGGSAALDAASPPVRSLRDLDGGGGEAGARFAAILLAGGAGTGTVAEAAPLAARLDLVGGATADWERRSGEDAPPWPPGAALLGRFYGAPVPGGPAAATATVRVGATRDRACDSSGSPWTPAAALLAAGGAAQAAAVAELSAGFALAWPPGAAWGAAPSRTLTGVRALAPRSAAGRPPLAGRLSSDDDDGGHNWWVLAGLGSRGLTYAAWVARLVAERAVAVAVAVAGGGEGGAPAPLPAELTRWQTDRRAVGRTSRPGRRRRRRAEE